MNRKFDVIVVGELNVDLVMNQIESFPEMGQEKIAGSMTMTLGSSSAIFASNLSALGAKVSFIAKVGNDVLGNFCKTQLEEKGVDTSMIIMSDKLKTGATVVLNYGEDRAMITHQGAMKHLALKHITKKMLSSAGHLHFSSYFLQPGLKDDLGLLFRMAREEGLSTSFDPQGDPAGKWEFDYKAILPYVDIFLPNDKELPSLVSRSTVEDAIEEIKDLVKIIVVKMGNKGSLSVFNGQSLLLPGFLNGHVVDAIGAGDSFNAGFVYKFLKDCRVESCQAFGNLVGAVSTTAAGGTGAFSNLKSAMKIAREKFGYEE